MTKNICSYEDSPWRTEFWRGRDYEDLAERIALKRMLPPRGTRLIEIGAGFGRLAEFYLGYKHIILLDYARTMLQQAREKILNDPRLAQYVSRFTFVAADLYNLPLANNSFDTALTVRVLHHVTDIPRAFAEFGRVVRPGGVYLLEHANKRHIKSIVRYIITHREPNPFTLEPYEFVKLNFDFHPRYIAQNLYAANFFPQNKRAVSTFRVPLFKKYIPAKILAAFDGILQTPLSNLSISPSLFILSQSQKPGAPTLNENLWRDPVCGATDIAETPAALTCRACGRVFPVVDGIIDFKSGM